MIDIRTSFFILCLINIRQTWTLAVTPLKTLIFLLFICYSIKVLSMIIHIFAQLISTLKNWRHTVFFCKHILIIIYSKIRILLFKSLWIFTIWISKNISVFWIELIGISKFILKIRKITSFLVLIQIILPFFVILN